MKKAAPLPTAQRPVSEGQVSVVTANIESQPQQFEEAMKAFHARDFATARKLFELVLEGPSREMAHVARLHIRMCDQRLATIEPELRTPDEIYHYAVGLINQRRLPEAEAKLRQALDSLPDSDYVHYALGITRGLQGDIQDAYKHLARSMQLDGRNRSLARSDPDFQEFGRQSPFRELVISEKKEPE